MEEEEVISEPEEILEEYDSGAEEGGAPPKNPSGAEAFLVVSFFGILPDVIDFFSIGGLSFLSSAISWPVTEYYFSRKNLQVPNVRKWIRIMNLGDAVPFLGVLPLKTTGLIIAIYVAWHPDSKIAKGAEALEAATGSKGGVKQAVRGKAEASVQRVKDVDARSDLKGRFKRVLPEYFEDEDEKEEEGDIYEEIREGGGGIRGPEEEAEAETFGEIISEPETEEDLYPENAPKKPQRPNVVGREEEQQQPIPLGDLKKDGGQEESAKIGGVYEEEKEVMKTMTSAGEPEDILKEKPIPISSRSDPQEIQSSDDGRFVNLKKFKDDSQQNRPVPQKGDGDSLKKAA